MLNIHSPGKRGGLLEKCVTPMAEPWVPPFPETLANESKNAAARLKHLKEKQEECGILRESFFEAMLQKHGREMTSFDCANVEAVIDSEDSNDSDCSETNSDDEEEEEEEEEEEKLSVNANGGEEEMGEEADRNNENAENERCAVNERDTEESSHCPSDQEDTMQQGDSDCKSKDPEEDESEDPEEDESEDPEDKSEDPEDAEEDESVASDGTPRASTPPTPRASTPPRASDGTPQAIVVTPNGREGVAPASALTELTTTGMQTEEAGTKIRRPSDRPDLSEGELASEDPLLWDMIGEFGKAAGEEQKRLALQGSCATSRKDCGKTTTSLTWT